VSSEEPLHSIALENKAAWRKSGVAYIDNGINDENKSAALKKSA